MLGTAGGWNITLVYGGAHFGKSLFWYSSELLFAFFLTEIAGLKPAEMGVVLVSGFLMSAGIDIVVGTALQRWLGNAHLASRAQVFGAVASAAALASVFLVAFVPPGWRFGLALVCGLAFRLAFATYDIPQNALMSLATSDRATRARVASTRIWFSGAATLVVAGAIGPMVTQASRDAIPAFLLAMSLGFAVVAVSGAALLAHNLAAAPIATPEGLPEPPARWQPSAEFWLLIAVSVITTLFTPTFAKLEPYFAAYSLQSAWWGGAIIIAMAAGIVAGQPLWASLVLRYPSSLVMASAALIQIVSLAAFWILGPAAPAALALCAFGFGIGNGGVGTIQWHAFSDIVARQAPRHTGVAVGTFVATGKLGFAAGAAMIAAALQVVSFRDSESSLLITLMVTVPAAGALLLLVVAWGLSLADFKARQGAATT